MLMKKAIVGNLIKSFNVQDMPDRGWIAGVVQRIEVDANDGVEYVYFRADFEAKDNVEAVQLAGDKTIRVPQNGTPTTMGSVMNCIEVIPRYNEKQNA